MVMVFDRIKITNRSPRKKSPGHAAEPFPPPPTRNRISSSAQQISRPPWPVIPLIARPIAGALARTAWRPLPATSVRNTCIIQP